MNKELMDILIAITRLIEDVNRTAEYANRRMDIDSTDTDAIFDNIACLQGQIYGAAGGGE